jgi:hypothetical protein
MIARLDSSLPNVSAKEEAGQFIYLHVVLVTISCLRGVDGHSGLLQIRGAGLAPTYSGFCNIGPCPDRKEKLTWRYTDKNCNAAEDGIFNVLTQRRCLLHLQPFQLEKANQPIQSNIRVTSILYFIIKK